MVEWNKANPTHPTIEFQVSGTGATVDGKIRCVQRLFSGDNKYRVEYATVGDLCITRKRDRERTSMQEPDKRLLVTGESMKDLEQFRLGLHSLLAAHAVDISSSPPANYALDIGCGRGYLSLCAKLQGARKIIGIDIDQGALDDFRTNILANGFDPQEFTLLRENICSIDRGQLPLEEIDAVYANIGAGQYKGDPDKHAIALLRHLPNARVFVGAGYARKAPYKPDDARRELKSIGFTHIIEIDQYANVPENNRVAIVARRH